MTREKWWIVYALREKYYDSESTDSSNTGCTEQSKFLVRCKRILYDPESGSSSGATHVPDQTSTILSSRTLPRCDSGFLRNTQNCTVIMGNVFERPPAQEGLHSTIFHNSKNFACSSQGLRPDTIDTARKRENGTKRASVNTPNQSPHFQSSSGMLHHTGWTPSHNSMVDYLRASIAELNLGKTFWPCGISTLED